MQQPIEEIDQFILGFNNQTSNSFIQSNINQEKLLVQNTRLLQQLNEQQRMLNLHSLLTQNILQNPYPNQQTTHKNKMIKKAKSNLQNIQSNACLLDQPLQIQEIKGNVKNAYIKKITSLLSVEGDKLLDKDLQENLEEDSSSQEPSKDKYGLAGLLCKDLLNEECKNKRIRQSAKKSRLRKKVYVKLLEKKVLDLDHKIQEYKQTTKQSFEYLTQSLISHPILNSMIIGNAYAIDQIMQSNQSDQAQLLIDSYIFRQDLVLVELKEKIT